MYISRTYDYRHKRRIYKTLTKDRTQYKSLNNFSSHLYRIFDDHCAGHYALDRATGRKTEIPDRSEKFLRTFLDMSKETAIKSTTDESWQFLDALRTAYVGQKSDFFHGSILDYFNLSEDLSAVEEATTLKANGLESTWISLSDANDVVAGLLQIEPSYAVNATCAVLWLRKSDNTVPPLTLENILQDGAIDFHQFHQWQAVGCQTIIKSKAYCTMNEDAPGVCFILRHFETMTPGTLTLSISPSSDSFYGQATLRSSFGDSTYFLEEQTLDQHL